MGVMAELVIAGMRVEVWDGDASHGLRHTRPGRARRRTNMGFVADDPARQSLGWPS
jgi:hypothetical protein